MAPQSLIPRVKSMYAATPSAAALLGIAATYGARILRSPPPEISHKEIGEFGFHNEILIPHAQYLYGASETGEPFIIGKKLKGEDYSAWEAEYKTFPKLRSLTLENSEARSIYSWSFEGPKASNSSGSWQLLLWFAIGILCALLLRTITRKVMNRFSPKKCDNEQEVLALPTSDIDVEHSKLTNLWRSTLIRMYREQKSEILSLSKLAGHYMDSNHNLRKLLAKEKKNKGEAKSVLATLKVEHADEVAELQKQIDDLKRMLDAKTESAKESESTNCRTEAKDTTGQHTIENVADVGGSEDPAVDPLVGCSSTDSRTKVEDTTSQETIQNAEDVAGSEKPVVAPVVGCSSTNGPTEAENETAHETIETIEDVAGSETPVVNPTMDGSSEQHRRPRIRANRRADGTIRTPSHPDYVPLEVSRSQLGDRPFNPADRGHGWRGGPGGRGRGRGGDRGGPFGWRGGRNRGGRGGGNVHDGQPNRGRGQ